MNTPLKFTPPAEIWLDGQGKVNELAFCEEFKKKYGEIRCINGQFYSLDGELDKALLGAEIYDELVNHGITTNTARKCEQIIGAMQKHYFSFAPPPADDEIHVNNGYLIIMPHWWESELGAIPRFVPEKKFCPYRIPVDFDPTPNDGKLRFNMRFTAFLLSLFSHEDMMTLLEFLGYCLLPTTKAQTAMFVVGNGGEGKSVIGSVVGKLFGKNMYGGSVHKLDEDKFYMANLLNKCLLLDDDAQIRAFSQTGNLKKLITANPNVPFDLQRKGEQGFQAPLFTRVLAFGNGTPKALYDRSDGFYRRMLILQTKPKPADRKDNPNLAEELCRDLSGIFNLCVFGLQSLLKSNYKFDVSDKAKETRKSAMRENNNVLDFIDEETTRAPELSVSSVSLYKAYCYWCDRNGLTPLARNSFLQEMKDQSAKIGAAYTTYIPDESGHRVRGFTGIALSTVAGA